MADVFVERVSFCTHLGKSIKGTVIGFGLMAASVALIFYNEFDTIQTQRALDEAEGLVTSLPSADAVDPAYEGKLVHLTALLDTDSIVTDPIFGVSTSDSNSEEALLKLHRTSEMYQWHEDKETDDAKTTYSYEKDWSEGRINSERFKKSENHYNPPMPYRTLTWTAAPLSFGAYSLSSDALQQVDWYDPFNRNLDVNTIFSEELRRETTVQGRYFYMGQGTLRSPEVGDVRVSFEEIKADITSVVAEQNGNSLDTYVATNGKEILLLQRGSHTSEAMFDQAEWEKQVRAWLLRFAGFLVMLFGMLMIVGPIKALFSGVPVLGDAVGCGLCCIVFPLALTISLLLIGIAWLAFRPLLGGGVLLAAVLLIVGLCMYSKLRQSSTTNTTKNDTDDDIEKQNTGAQYNSTYSNKQEELAPPEQPVALMPVYVPYSAMMEPSQTEGEVVVQSISAGAGNDKDTVDA